MLTLLGKLHRTGLLTVAGVFGLVEAVLSTGINLMALLRLAARLHPTCLAVTDDQTAVSYQQLWQQAEALARALQADYGVRPQQKVAIACRNHLAGIKAIFAASRLGAHVYLINPEMRGEQLQGLHERLQFDLFIHDRDVALPVGLQERSLPAYDATAASVDQLSTGECSSLGRLPNVKTGNIVVMTGGTTGQPRPASRKPDLLSFLPPFVALLQQVHLDRYRSLFIATPIYHGFGLAALFIGLILGAELYVTPRFEAACACELIARHRVSVVTLVPLMLQRLLKQDVAAISCVQCFLTGGAHLQPPLAQAVLTRLGPVLFNLYGTSEAGFCVIGTPTLLQRKPYALGKPVPGVRVNIMRDPLPEKNRPAVGQLCIRSAWSTRQQDWIETGDLAYQDAEGDIVLCGRVDDMIVSGGENVYPVELENVLAQHPEVAAVAAVGIPDAEFGQRLKAIVVGREGTAISPDALLSWLKLRVARYQMPAVIEVRTELPYTSLGKLDKKALR